MLTLSKLVEGSTRYLTTKDAKPFGSPTRAVTVTIWPEDGRTGEWVTSWMAGPAFVTLRLLGKPGVPRLAGTAILPVASSQLPFNRSKGSGDPRSQRNFARKVAVLPLARVELRAARMRLAAVSQRLSARMWRLRELLYPEFSRLDPEWLPCGTQPVKPPSKVGLGTTFPPPEGTTSTLSIRHSPRPSNPICRVSAGKPPFPLSSVPVNSMLVQELLVVSSLSVQFDGKRLSLFGSISSRLLPPPSA